jgi:DNA adenine methylase
MKIEPISPLRYPGGKKFLFPYIDSILKEKLYLGCEFYEPYGGGAALSLHLLFENTISRAIIVEKDPLIYSFWKSVIYHTDQFCEKVFNVNVTVDNWHKFQKYLSVNADKLYDVVDLGLAGLFFNRVNYSGILTAGPIGGYSQQSKYKIDCRFNKSRIIKLVKKVSEMRGRLSIVRRDGLSYLQENAEKISKNGFAYVDPPYYSNGERLYRYYFSEVQHKKLASFLQCQSFPWIVSYDYTADVLNNFYDQRIRTIYLNHALTRSYKVRELLISNFILPEPCYLNADQIKQNSLSDSGQFEAVPYNIRK